MTEKTQIVIIGGGIAGAATAFFLARQGHRDIILLEKEFLAGSHSSGRNASLMRQIVPEPVNCRLAVESMRFFVDPPEDFPLPLHLRQTGSIILTGKQDQLGFQKIVSQQKQLQLDVHFFNQRELLDMVPALNPTAVQQGGLVCPTDGILDIHNLLQGFLQGAQNYGAKIYTKTKVQKILSKDKHTQGVLTNRGMIHAEWIVNAAGAWASHLIKTSNTILPIHPSRRHLIVTRPFSWTNPDWPFVWDVSAGFYFRPEDHGIMMSPCDTDELPPGNTPTDPQRVAEAISKAPHLLRNIEPAEVMHAWAGLRNLTPDHHFIIGEDPHLKKLFWVAGLGGHGMTASPILGKIAADLISTGKTEAFDPTPFAPQRFLTN